MKALVGHTGFVGSHLAEQVRFDLLFNSKNSQDLRGKDLDLLVFSGAKAEKWKANQDPAGDAAHIDELIDLLGTVKAKKAVLISTVDVYLRPNEVDEMSEASTQGLHAYGLNRLRLENFFNTHFQDSYIVRLPGLFGKGIKKNVVYDFLNNNQTEKIDSRGVFQFYDLSWIWKDIAKAMERNIRLLNISVEPTSVADVAKVAFGRDFKNEVLPQAARYDMRSRYAELWAGSRGYLYNRDQVLAAMKKFVASERKTP